MPCVQYIQKGWPGVDAIQAFGTLSRFLVSLLKAPRTKVWPRSRSSLLLRARKSRSTYRPPTCSRTCSHKIQYNTAAVHADKAQI